MLCPLRFLPIRTKLVVLVAASGFIALLLCCGGFALHDIRNARSARVRELQTATDVVAVQCAAALSADDASAAERLLTSFRFQPSVEAACLYDPSGKILATFVADGAIVGSFPPGRGNGIQAIDVCQPTDDGRVEFFHDVVDNGHSAGTLYVMADMEDLKTQIWDYTAISAAVMLCSLAVSMILSVGLQRSISRPIEALAKASEQITSEGDYSIRVNSLCDNELDDLCHTFNSMLDRIEASEHALQRANDRLEDRVMQRTVELEDEIGHRRLVEADLKRSRDAAEAANRAKSQFLANMSHEIRTPMNAILGFTDLLRKGADGGNEAERQDYLETIHTSGKHLLGLINDILDLSKIEAGRFDVRRVRCSPHKVIAEVVSVLRVRAQQRGLALEFEWAGGIPETVETDPARLRELMMNLIGNAIKFTKVGRVQVTGRLTSLDARPLMEIQVVDTGVGIAPENLERIFDPFVQADTSVTREYGGTGLGLAICYRITEALGGTLTVASEFGKGSVFTATVETGPLDDVKILSAPPTDAVSAARDVASAPARKIPGASILLVEDGDTNRKLITIVLQRAGAKVTCAVNGQIGVELASERIFDLILMDMQMPVMDGYTATRRLRQQGVTTPIFALTAHAMKGDQQRCEAAGCSGFLTKPIEPDELLHEVANALGDRNVPIDEGPTETAETQLPNDPLVSTLPTDDPDFREVVEEFTERFHEKIDAMRRAAEVRDFEEVARLGHWLKGAGGTAGFAALTDPAKNLEAAARGDHFDRVDDIIAQLADMADRIVIAS